jgi:TatD DNase family protein
VRGEKNAPKNVVHTARYVAGRLGVDEEGLAGLTTRNARNLFGLPLEV